MFSLVEIADLLKQIATKHEQINSMGFGDYSDIATEKLMLYSGSDPNKVTYPLLWVVPGGVDVERGISRVKVNVLVIDVLHLDNKNLLDVLNDTLLISHDVNALLHDQVNRDNYALDNAVSFKPFFEEQLTDEGIGGWEAEYTFKINSLRDRCAVPLSSAITMQ